MNRQLYRTDLERHLFTPGSMRPRRRPALASAILLRVLQAAAALVAWGVRG